MVAFTTLCGLRRADRFRQHIGNPAGRDHRAHRAAGDHAGTFGGRLQQHHASCRNAQHLVRNRGLQQVDLGADSSWPLRCPCGSPTALPSPCRRRSRPPSPTGSPITTSAEKLRFLPPLTTLVTRLIATTCSFRFSVCGSMRFAVVLPCIKTPVPLRAPHRPAP